MQYRRATAADVPAITRIYNQGIADRVATLETEERSEAERLAWLTDSHTDRYPVYVAEADGQVVGWASLNAFNARTSYRHVADFSVYVERQWRSQGVGKFLLGRLIETARQIGFHKLVLTALPTNDRGMALYRRLGFHTVGVYKEQGLVDGCWVDTVIMELLL